MLFSKDTHSNETVVNGPRFWADCLLLQYLIEEGWWGVIEINQRREEKTKTVQELSWVLT